MKIKEASLLLDKIALNIEKVIKGKRETIDKVLAGFLAGGHILINDVPGTGKTTLAKALALSVNTDFKRIQFTPDLLPSDLTGVSIFNKQTETFVFHKGPVFTNILLADEINRAGPKTQSALLEAMEEKQISAEGNIYRLNPDFFVIATQNPIEMKGTYPLPESQLDRFAMELAIGYLSRDEEVEMISEQEIVHPIENISEVTEAKEVAEAAKTMKEIRLSEEIKYYIVDIITGIRNGSNVILGPSPRAAVTLANISKAFALIEGIEFVTPEIVRKAAIPVLSHRVRLESTAKFSGIDGRQIVNDIISSLKVPA